MGFIVPVLQTEKLRLRKIKKLSRKTLLGKSNSTPPPMPPPYHAKAQHGGDVCFCL